MKVIAARLVAPRDILEARGQAVTSGVF